MKLTRQDYILAGGQALLWITLWLIPPAIDFFIRFNPSSAFEVWKINTGFITPVSYTHLDVYKRQVLHESAIPVPDHVQR